MLLLLALVLFSVIPLGTGAAPIDDTYKYARLHADNSLINFKATNSNVDVTSSAITGYAWGENVGWINLAPTNGGIARDGSGNLSGYAWGEGVGWVNFNPTNGGVSIDSEGFFHGHAWSDSRGWISFNCDDDSSCGTVDHKVKVNEGGGGGGGGSTPNPPTPGGDVCPNIDGTQSSVPVGMFIDSFGNCITPRECIDPVSGEKQALQIMLVMDKSGSMSGGKMTAAKNSAKFFVDSLNPFLDRAGLSAYQSSATLHQGLTNNFVALRSAIDSLIASGGTNIADGIRLARNELINNGVDGVKRVMITLSDGQATAPNPDPSARAIERAEEAKADGIVSYSIGLGNGADANTLRAIASDVNKYYFAPSESELQQIYQEISAVECVRPVSDVSGIVINDVDQDGVRDGGEPGVSDFDIVLFESNDSQPLRSATSGATGVFTFYDVLPGTYSACPVVSAEWTQSIPNTTTGCYDFVVTEGNDVTGLTFGVWQSNPGGDYDYPVIQCEIDGVNGWYGRYYNHTVDHPHMQTRAGSNSGDPLGDVLAWIADWYDDQYFSFERIDQSLAFGSGFFPFDEYHEELIQRHEYFFTTEWSSLIVVPEGPTQSYSFTLISDDDSWFYVDGNLVADNSGVHAARTITDSVVLTPGVHELRIFFAERNTSNSHMTFGWNNGVSFEQYNGYCDGPDVPDPPEPPVEPEDPDPEPPLPPVCEGDDCGNPQPPEQCVGDDCDPDDPDNPPFWPPFDPPGIPPENPLPPWVPDVVPPIGLLAGGLALLIALITSYGDLVYLPIRIWNSLLGILGFRKRGRPWGTVYDSVTKQPLDPAYVSIKDASGKEVGSALTDLDGRYGFLVEQGSYTMEANKTHYTFPSVNLSGKQNDELYRNLYFGDVVEIKSDAEVVVHDIPMDPVGFDWNEFQKKDKKLMRFYSRYDVWITRLLDVLFYLGFFISIIAFYYTPGPYNSIILVLYIIIFVLRIFGVKMRLYGKIRDSLTGDPLSFAIMRVYNANLGKEIMHRVADKFGRYYALVPKGRYYVVIEKKLADGNYEKVHMSRPFDAPQGIIKKIFRV